MPGPLDALRYVHNAIRAEVSTLEQAVRALDSDSPDPEQAVPLRDRFDVLHEFLADHEAGEERVFFPAFEGRIPHVVVAYEMDHRANDEVLAHMDRALTEVRQAATRDALRRATRDLFGHTSAMAWSMRLHLRKEEQHLAPLTEARFTPPEIGTIVGGISAGIPPDRMPRTLLWMFERMAPEERAGLLGIMRAGAPPQAYQGITGVLARGLAPDAWADLEQRMAAGGDPAAAAQVR